uniref:Uncharacterized protein n=1 Tax=Arundo donax TaxID=35708 RepID=A0A0A9U1V7_ARUDO
MEQGRESRLSIIIEAPEIRKHLRGYNILLTVAFSLPCACATITHTKIWKIVAYWVATHNMKT